MAVLEFFSLPSIIIACFMHMITGAIWYSMSMFGKQFMRLAFPKRKDMHKNTDSMAIAMVAASLGTAISMPFFCFLLRVAQVKSAGEGALWGAALGLFFDGGLNASHNFFEERPFALFVIHRGYHTFSLICIGLVLGTLCGTA